MQGRDEGREGTWRRVRIEPEGGYLVRVRKGRENV